MASGSSAVADHEGGYCSYVELLTKLTCYRLSCSSFTRRPRLAPVRSARARPTRLQRLATVPSRASASRRIVVLSQAPSVAPSKATKRSSRLAEPHNRRSPRLRRRPTAHLSLHAYHLRSSAPSSPSLDRHSRSFRSTRRRSRRAGRRSSSSRSCTRRGPARRRRDWRGRS